MSRLAITLFGALQISLNGKPIGGIASNKVRALLTYLAVEIGRPHRRDVLAEMFWPKKPQGVARKSLKQAIANLRKAIGDRESSSPFLLISREEIQFNSGSNHWIDTNEFVDLLETSKKHTYQKLGDCSPSEKWLRRAVGIYRGDFLREFSLPDCQTFEEWALINRESFRHQMSDALRKLSMLYEECEEYEDACQYARQLVDLEPWNEENHRWLMRLLALRGMRSEALRQYQTCQQILTDEFRVEPTQETTTLYEKIRIGRMEKVPAPASQARALDQEPYQPKPTKISWARLIKSRILQLPRWVLPLAGIIVVGITLLTWLGLLNLKPHEAVVGTKPEIQSALIRLYETVETASDDSEVFSVLLKGGTAWYVSIDGDDSNDCLSSTTACASINGALRKPGFSAGDTTLVATGIYTDIGSEVVLLFRDVILSGGWNSGFTSQSGISIIDGENIRRGMTIYGGVTAIVERFTIQQGSSDNGGGILNRGTLMLINSTISDNTASIEGGGINVQSGAFITLNNCTVNNNLANSGGGIFNSSGTLISNNSTISNNLAEGGGGINNLGGFAELNSSTISTNAGISMGGGGIRNEAEGTMTLQNSILAGNTGSGPDCSGVISSSGYNLIGNTSQCTFLATVGDLTDIKPKLSILQDNGGLTLTHGLLRGSPAIDAGQPAVPGSGEGACRIKDQRGFTRPIDGDEVSGSRCDIGAYELDPASPP